MSEERENKVLPYGGQAIMEGVMMRSPRRAVAAVRAPDGEIVTRVIHESDGILPWYRKVPFIRGVFGLVSAMTIGIKALNFSAEVAMKEDEDDKPMHPVLEGLLFTVSFLIGIGLFMVLPARLPDYLAAPLGLDAATWNGRIWLNIIEGGFRIIVFVGYLFIISLFKDIRRIFEYHGAEHKVIWAFERGQDLTVENVQENTTLHPRCGTSFIFMVVIIAILSHIPLPWEPVWLRIACRFAVLPLVAGISFEYLQLAGRYRCHPVIRFMGAPGLWLQKITTKPPSDDMIEVSLTAFRETANAGEA